MASQIISSFLQVIVFALIPFLVFLIRNNGVKGFFQYIGLKRSNARANGLSILLVFVLAFPLIIMSTQYEDFRTIMTDPNSMTGKFRAMGFGFNSVVLILVTAGIKTSFSEEILFRGFLAKRLIAISGFWTGNIIHAVIFGGIHTLLFLSITNNPLFLFVIFFFPACGSVLKVIINEKIADGSIIPGWIAHGVSNIIAYSFIAYMI